MFAMIYSTYKGNIVKLEDNEVAVCGTNTEGRSGMGFALWCKKNAGLLQGHTKGMCGKTYGIVTKDLTKGTHPSVSVELITAQIIKLYAHASLNTNKRFLIPYKGTGVNLNNYTPEEMATIFINVENIGKMAEKIMDMSGIGIPRNIIFEESFAELMTKIKTKKT